VIVEIPDRAMPELENPGSTELQVKALGIAMNATWNQRVKYRNFQFSSWSSSVVVEADPANYGGASFMDREGCCAWILESPLLARHANREAGLVSKATAGEKARSIGGRLAL
jgi:hypothetical protein